MYLPFFHINIMNNWQQSIWFLLYFNQSNRATIECFPFAKRNQAFISISENFAIALETKNSYFTMNCMQAQWKHGGSMNISLKNE